MTVRIDLVTHRQLRELSGRYGRLMSMHVSRADLVRMGVSLLALELERRELSAGNAGWSHEDGNR